MAQSFLVPTATCVLTSATCANVKGYVWLGIVAPVDGAACCAFYSGSATDGTQLWTLAASKGTAVGPIGPFKVASCSMTVYADLVGTRASALIATASY